MWSIERERRGDDPCVGDARTEAQYRNRSEGEKQKARGGKTTVRKNRPVGYGIVFVWYGGSGGEGEREEQSTVGGVEKRRGKKMDRVSKRGDKALKTRRGEKNCEKRPGYVEKCKGSYLERIKMYWHCTYDKPDGLYNWKWGSDR